MWTKLRAEKRNAGDILGFEDAELGVRTTLQHLALDVRVTGFAHDCGCHSHCRTVAMGTERREAGNMIERHEEKHNLSRGNVESLSKH